MNKKALMMKFLIAIIVLAVTLAVLIYFWSQLNAGSNIDKTACLTSVQARSTFNLGKLVEPGKDFIPLNCKTEKLCISSSGDNCDARGFNPSKENQITKIKVKETTRQTTLETISNSLYDCHKMLGQGKLNFLPSRWSSKNYCLICSRIALDEEARQDVKDITYMELYQYMQRKTNSDGISDLEFVYGVKGANEMIITLTKVTEAIKNEKGIEVAPSDLKINLGHKEGNAVIVQLSPESTWEAWVGSAIGTPLVLVGGAEIVIGIVGAPFTGGTSLALTVKGAGILLLGGLGFGAATSEIGGTALGDGSQALVSGPILVTETPDGASYGRPTLYTYNADVLRSLQCSSFELAP